MADSAQLQIDIGNTVRASSAAVAFLWTNWEHLYALNPGHIVTRRMTENSWRSKGFHGSGDFYLVRSYFEPMRGSFEYYSFLSFMGASFRITTELTYRRLDREMISFFGRSKGLYPHALRPIHWLLHNLAARAAQYVVRVGGQTATRITDKPSILETDIGEECYKKFLAFSGEEHDIESGRGRKYVYFARPDPTSEVSPNKTRMADLENRVAALEQHTLVPNGLIRFGEYHTAISLFQTDPGMALVKNRTLVEAIAKHVFEDEIGQISDARMLGELIDLIAKRCKRVPGSILALMRTVSLLGNVGGHVAPGRDGANAVTEVEFAVSFMATLRITEWYLGEFGTVIERTHSK